MLHVVGMLFTLCDEQAKTGASTKPERTAHATTLTADPVSSMWSKMCLRSPAFTKRVDCNSTFTIIFPMRMLRWIHHSTHLQRCAFVCLDADNFDIQHTTYNIRHIFNLPHSLFFSPLQSHNLASDPRYKDTFNRLLQRFRFLSTTGMPMAGLSDNRQLETWDTHLQCQQIKEHQCFEPCVCLHTNISRANQLDTFWS